MIKPFLSISLLFFVLIGHSQNFNFKKFKIDDGLPSNDIYDIVEDSNGYIWMATEYGVCRFDGYDFKRYSIDEGLPELSCIKLFVDRNNLLWVSTNSGHLAYFQNDTFLLHHQNKKIRQLSKYKYLEHLYVDRNNVMWLSPYAGGLYKIADSNIKILSDTAAYSNSNLYFKQVEGEIVFNKPNKIFNGSGANIALKKSETGCVIKNPISNTIISYFDVLQLHDTLILMSINNKLYSINNDELTLLKEYDDNIVQLYFDKDYFMVSVDFNGVYKYDYFDIAESAEKLFPGKLVSNIHKDYEGSYWFTVFNEGVYLVPSFTVKAYNSSLNISNTSIYDFDINNGKIVFSTLDRKVYLGKVNNDEIFDIQEFITKKNRSNIVTNVLLHNDGSVWMFGAHGIKFNQNGESLPVESTMNSGYSLYVDNKGLVYHGDQNSFNIYKNNKCVLLSGCELNNIGKTVPKFSNSCFNHKVYCFYKDQKNVLWLGTNDGLYSYKNGDYKNYGINYIGLSRRISGIKGLNNLLVVSVRDYGIVIKQNDKYYNILLKDEINASAINDLEVYSDSSIWLATNSGISKIKIHEFDPLVYSVYNYTKWDGILSNDVKKLKSLGNYLWMSSESGLACLNTKTLTSSTLPPKIKLINVFVNGKQGLENLQSLKPSQNNIKINYKAISYKSPGNLTYKYILEGYHTDWEYTNITEVNFVSLPPGKYNFKVTAQNIHGVWNDNYASIMFRIRSPLINRWWFIISLVIFAVVILVIAYSLRVRAIRKKNNLEQNLINYHQQALSKQMNPHFIYNSLNSIHRYILENDRNSSSKYLTKFSKLMRLTLEVSKRKMILIQEEVDLLILYLDLEAMRFKQLFTYNIRVHDEVETINIPPFLIQPFVENAIWHGLMHKTGDKNLEIDFSLKDNKVVCEILDNGIGRKAASRRNKGLEQTKKSYGIELIQQRIDLLNQTVALKYSFEIEDLFDTDGPAGTRVSLFFPKNELE